MTERPIGSTFDDPKYGKIQVVEGTTTCEGCVYADMKAGLFDCNTQNTGYCHEAFRSDHKNVIFKRIDNNTKKMSKIENITDTRPVGSIFNHPQYGQLQVVEQKDCEGCVFETTPSLCPIDTVVGLCGEMLRTDGKEVIFKPYKK